MSKADALISAVLRGQNPPWPEGADDAFISLFLERSAYHGVEALLHQRLPEALGGELGWPRSVLEACRGVAVSQAMWEMRHKEILGRLLARIADAGVRPILFKGTALAYSLYPAPFLRTRGDTDLLIPDQAREQVCEALESVGLECVRATRGDLISNTAIFSLADTLLGLHEIDLHWRISNAQVLSRLFSYDELAAAALPLPALSTHAFAPSHMHALAIACMHRAGHKECPYFVDGIEYYGGDRLIWFYDMHLICKGWSEADYQTFLDFAAEKGLAKICLEGLEQARIFFGSGVPEELADKHRLTDSNESVSTFLGSSPVHQLYGNFLAVEGTGNKIRYLKQVFFPPAKYMRDAYGQKKPNWLVWLYIHRIVSTAAKRLGRTLSRSRAS